MAISRASMPKQIQGGRTPMKSVKKSADKARKVPTKARSTAPGKGKPVREGAPVASPVRGSLVGRSAPSPKAARPRGMMNEGAPVDSPVRGQLPRKPARPMLAKGGMAVRRPTGGSKAMLACGGKVHKGKK